MYNIYDDLQYSIMVIYYGGGAGLAFMYFEAQHSKANIERSHRCHRLRPQHDPDKRASCPIIVKFISYRKRSEVLSQRRKLAGSRKYIQEDLTRESAKLLKATRDHPKVKAAWTRDGRVVALVPATNGREMKRAISSEADLSLL